MRTIWFEPLGRDLGQLVLGTNLFDPADQSAASMIMDAFVELGGQILDTAENYGRGDSERVIGRWLRQGGRRESVVILSKGAHPYDGVPRVTQEAIREDLMGSLDRLGVDSIDIYLLHRDDESVPVGPILEALNEHKAAGRIRTFGASNWSIARLDEASDYAARNELEPFTSSSVQFGLGIPSEEPWPGCISGRDPGSSAWYERTQLPLFAWSSQSAGFFGLTDNDAPDPEFQRVYDTTENRARRRRAAEVAARLGTTPTQVALAWVATQPFPVFPIVRSRDAAHLAGSAGALDLPIDATTRAWLDQGVAETGSGRPNR